MQTLTKCCECGYPIQANVEGDRTACAYCGTQLQAIAQGVTIPTPLFIGVLMFGIGVLLGPALIATTDGGRRWLEKQARGIGT